MLVKEVKLWGWENHFILMKSLIKIKELCFNGPLEKLSYTPYTQPCMVMVATIITDLLKEHGIVPDYTAGLSLGEYSALYCAGVFKRQQVIDLARFRGKVMQEAVSEIESEMIAVLGMKEELLQDLCHQASSLGVVSISNYNCPGQLVVAGEKKAVEKVKELALENKARRVIALNTSGPFHTSLLKEASLALKERFKKETFHEMKIPVIFNTLGHEIECQSIPEILEKQVNNMDIPYVLEEVKDLFLSDAHVLDLDVEEIIPAGGDLSKYSLLTHISKIELQNNQHIVVLFVKIYEDGNKERIRDFHFLRYDKEKGWSEKRLRNNVYFFEDISREWPSCWNDRTVGAFKITR